MTLQYDGSDGKTHYDEVATVTAKKGEWTKLANPEFEIPEGATGMLLYFETPDDEDNPSLIDFYVDSAYGGVKGADPLKNLSGGSQPEETTEAPKDETTKAPTGELKPGDVDENGEVNVADAVLLARYSAEDKEVTITATGLKNADLTGDGKVNSNDTARLLEKIAGLA